MARDPVTRMQLDAYRFGERRMEAALARRDPVLLHEEIRSQRRVVGAGLVLALLVLAGSFGYARLTDDPAWDRQAIVRAEPSGRTYVVLQVPTPRLVPVANVAAGRLVLAAVDKRMGRSGRSGAATPTRMPDRALDAAPRTPAAAVPGAEALLPDGDDLPAVGAWAVCDAPGPGRGTTVVAGAAPAPAAADGLLLSGPGGDLHLVVGGVRHRIDSRSAVLQAYDLVDAPPRPVSDALLAAVPEGDPLRLPRVAGAGQVSGTGLPARVGEVVRVAPGTGSPGAGSPGAGSSGAGSPGAGDRLYVVLAGGVHEVAPPVATLLRIAAHADLTEPAPAVRAEQVNAVPRVGFPALDQLPASVPAVPKDADRAFVCWRWDESGAGGRLALSADALVPAGRSRTGLAQADGAGPRLDEVSLPTGVPIVVRGVTEAAAGGLWLVSDTGVAYPVASDPNGGGDTATALGIRPGSASAAPEQALRQLPTAPVLDVAQAMRTIDVPGHPVGAG